MENIIAAVALLAIMGLVFGFILAIAAKVFAVETDPRQEPLTEALPGANCGGCGYAGCSAYAAAVIAGTAKIGDCPVGGAAVAEKMGEIMGLKVEAKEPEVAYPRCTGGGREKARYQYVGIHDCLAATRVPGGTPLTCQYACLGFGTCERACTFDAITMVDGLPQVDDKKCTGCGACVRACPKDVMALHPVSAPIIVECSSKANGKITMQGCKDGCIGCKLCEKNCPTKAITVTNFLASVDYSLCNGCLTCVEKCPKKIIKVINGKAAVEEPAG